MLRVALTGGIGTGKSTASKILNELGAFIFDADKEAKNILKNNETVQSELIAEFGTDIMRGDEKIDNNKLARIAFQDQDHQLRLNSIIHPYVFQEIDEILKRIDLQWPEEEKIALADFVIHNDSTEKELLNSITDIYNKLV